MELWIAFDAMFLFALRLGSHLKEKKNMKNLAKIYYRLFFIRIFAQCEPCQRLKIE